jgi:hypothetical protein
LFGFLARAGRFEHKIIERINGQSAPVCVVEFPLREHAVQMNLEFEFLAPRQREGVGTIMER